MMALLTPVLALTSPPPPTVALSDGPEFAAIALLAVVLAAASVVVRGLHPPVRQPAAGSPRAALEATRARS